MKIKKQVDATGNEKGMVLVVVLLLLSALIILGTTTIMQTSTDLKISGNYKSSVQAFYDADAGVQYAIAKMEEGLKSSPQTFTLPSAGSPATLTYTTPTGFSFTISTIANNAGSNTYTFTSTGNGPNNTQAVIVATLGGDSAINYAIFGDSKSDTKSGGSTLSYDSGSTDPTKNDPSDPSFVSTHEADIGSNDWLVTHSGAYIDGDGGLGEQDDGSLATDGIDTGTTFYGTAPVNVGRIDPDPLGINSGGEYDPSTYATINDNAAAGLGTTIKTAASITLTAGDYYFTDIELKSGADLVIDPSAGPVNIFLTGGLSAKVGSTINNTGKPTDLSIYSNSSTKISLANDGEFKAFVYSPFTPVDMGNSSNTYGAIWASNVDVKNGGTFYYDAALKDKYMSNDLLLTAWKDDSA